MVGGGCHTSRRGGHSLLCLMSPVVGAVHHQSYFLRVSTTKLPRIDHIPLSSCSLNDMF